MAAKEAALKDVLGRLDVWLGKTPARGKLVAPAASDTAIAKVEKEIDAKLPAVLRALYKWHDGEAKGANLFDALCRDDHVVEWETYNKVDREVRFMSLAELAKAGKFPAFFDDDTGECMRGENDSEEVTRTTLVPFAWMRAKGAPLDDGPADDDWLVAVDTLHEAVFLFEIANEGLEGVVEEAASFAGWLGARVARLEKGEISLEAGPAPSARAKVRPPGELLLQFLQDRKLLEMAEGATLASVGAKLAPLLALKPEKRAIKEVISFLEDDDGVDEVFADDEMLKAIVAEFLD